MILRVVDDEVQLDCNSVRQRLVWATVAPNRLLAVFACWLGGSEDSLG